MLSNSVHMLKYDFPSSGPFQLQTEVITFCSGWPNKRRTFSSVLALSAKWFLLLQSQDKKSSKLFSNFCLFMDITFLRPGFMRIHEYDGFNLLQLFSSIPLVGDKVGCNMCCKIRLERTIEYVGQKCKLLVGL